MKKKILCVAVSCAMCLVSYPCSVAESAVLEPKLVHTERWTTSYYIDDDKDTLYPYIQCVANIYSNGYVVLYMWNTHEWDGYETQYNTITFLESVPYITSSADYCHMKGVQTAIDISYYPDYYNIEAYCDFNEDWNPYFTNTSTYPTLGVVNRVSVKGIGYNLELCKLKSYPVDREIKEEWSKTFIGSMATYRPFYYAFGVNNSELLNNVGQFRLFGHEFTITPEMLNNETPTLNDVSGSINEELEKYKALYEEAISASKEKDEAIEALKSEIESLKANQPVCGDTDDDGRVSIADSVVLNRYLAGTIESLPCKNPPPDDEPEED